MHPKINLNFITDASTQEQNLSKLEEIEEIEDIPREGQEEEGQVNIFDFPLPCLDKNDYLERFKELSIICLYFPPREIQNSPRNEIKIFDITIGLITVYPFLRSVLTPLTNQNGGILILVHVSGSFCQCIVMYGENMIYKDISIQAAIDVLKSYIENVKTYPFTGNYNINFSTKKINHITVKGFLRFIRSSFLNYQDALLQSPFRFTLSEKSSSSSESLTPSPPLSEGDLFSKEGNEVNEEEEQGKSQVIIDAEERLNSLLKGLDAMLVK